MDIYMPIYTYVYIRVFHIYHLSMHYAMYMYVYIYTLAIHNSTSYISSLTKHFSSVYGNW